MQKTGKLELTWVGKYDDKVVEPRILLEDVSNSYGDPSSDNMLIHGDNLIALQALQQDYAGRVKCIYIDPPYNTGNAFDYYDDGVEHSIWLNLMRQRLVLLRELLSEEGSIWIQIDDEEQAYLKVLCDEIFGRVNFVNMISVNMKNIAGASGGGEDKRIKKNCEYILIYAKDYYRLDMFKGAYDYEEIGALVERYREEGISWKYSSALVNPGEKIYVGSTVDGTGDEIKIFKRVGFEIKSVNQLMQEDGISERDAYNKYAKYFFVSQMPQSSIRPKVMEKVNEIGKDSELYSIEYVPKTGRNKGKLYEQFYKGKNFRLFAWLRDVSEEIDGSLYKKTLQGTYWNYVSGTKNLTKEGNVEFPNGKKPESLISRVFDMASDEGDIVLDSFLGSGTSAAVAHKMNRTWIGIEMGDHAYSHCKARLDRVIDGKDSGGITKDYNWQGGGGYHFYELAPSLLVKNDKLPIYQINPSYTFEMLCEAICKIEGFRYKPQDVFHGHSSEKRYIHITTEFIIILQAVYTYSLQDEYKDVIDPYYSLVGYFNSIRELGGAVRLLQDDIPKRIYRIKNKYGLDKQRYLNHNVEITSRMSSYKIPEKLNQLETTCDSKECLDTAIATNMIAVGMDVDRLGLMVVTGQPKQNSEYIQATSRIGRAFPGLVVTLYNAYRPRDLSHYENFTGYHSQLYRFVEGTTATPFSARARDRVMHALVISAIRLNFPNMSNNTDAAAIGSLTKEQLDSVKSLIIDRLNIIKPSVRADAEEEIDRFIDWWKLQAAQTKPLRYYVVGTERYNRLMNPYDQPHDENEKATLRSMREVESSANMFYYTEE